MKAAAGEGYATATDLADWLVRTLKMPFRDAHHVTGRIVAAAPEARRAAARVAAEGHAGDRAEDHRGGVGGAVGRGIGEKPRPAYGGTAPKNVLAQAKGWLKRLEKERKLG